MEENTAVQPNPVEPAGTLLTDPAAEPAPAGTLLTDPEAEPASAQPEPAPVIPEAYDIKTLDGYELIPETMEQIAPLLKKHKITQEGAQELANAHMEIMKKQTENHEAFRAQTLKNWVETAKKDSDFGGINFDKNLALAKRGLTAVMPEAAEQRGALTELLEASGMGNHPEMLKMFARIGKMVSEDSLLNTGTVATGKGKFDPARQWFPKSLGDN